MNSKSPGGGLRSRPALKVASGVIAPFWFHGAGTFSHGLVINTPTAHESARADPPDEVRHPPRGRPSVVTRTPPTGWYACGVRAHGIAAAARPRQIGFC
ncbi:hypothetical protein EYF80_063473 [Liparis tanakae]|uniref:Uncharacterized protein n=1 Tax=Liparis tanakae TaxID=230148 RepID=A0A4Z2EC39_9TELE|nr:hypothetical protein EYF80_063473 [Liparis tanakae]